MKAAYKSKATFRSILWGIALIPIMLFHNISEAKYQVDANLLESIKWYTGETGKVDDSKAKTLLEKAASTHDPLAIMWIARVYSTGRMGFPADKDKAKEIAAKVITDVEQLAQQQVAEANFLMGTAYAEGLGKTKNDEEAVIWYRRAAIEGHVLAQHNLGNVYASGTGVQQNDELAVNWWRQAAEQGDAIPQYQLGVMYEKGKGVSKDLKTSIDWYQKAADRGNAKAKSALQRLGAFALKRK
ncbi:tetratricopeptide repeat protein [Aliiglaciecola lipolytica]|uniref:Sel1 repeat family protein n=1 Tax=Aliiglaciecola lipolytica E3 TaxID=1127673 RepID=K6YC60_9ALTE|nr:tetratricopeptide repeat protein [Aliiglaciecola lipolytica]GAC14238.1 hypothetical protein GLIP_1604 [Aliiglaciecola lipolytica E3]